MTYISEFDKEHIEEILAGEGTWFGADLIRLIAKADKENYGRLRKAFPDAVAAYEDWLYERGPYAKDKEAKR